MAQRPVQACPNPNGVYVFVMASLVPTKLQSSRTIFIRPTRTVNDKILRVENGGMGHYVLVKPIKICSVRFFNGACQPGGR